MRYRLLLVSLFVFFCSQANQGGTSSRHRRTQSAPGGMDRHWRTTPLKRENQPIVQQPKAKQEQKPSFLDQTDPCQNCYLLFFVISLLPG